MRSLSSADFVACPWCKTEIIYRNMDLRKKYIFRTLTTCRKCYLRFYLCSALFKFLANYYYPTDFLRRNYLMVRDRLLVEKVI